MKIIGKNILIISIIAILLTWILAIFFELQVKSVKADASLALSQIATIQGNSIVATSSPIDPVKPLKKIKVIVTAYSSTVWETDDTPFITAAGTQVREGIVANNKLSFGTEVKFPEVYGDKIFVVEDRMNSRKGPYQFDIWMGSHEEAENFGAKIIEAEIL